MMKSTTRWAAQSAAPRYAPAMATNPSTTAVGPLHALELGPAGAQEVQDAVATGARTAALVGRDARCGAPGQRLVFELTLGQLRHLAPGTGDDRGLGLVDVARGVLELAGNVFSAERVVVVAGSVRGHARLSPTGSPGGWYGDGTTCRTCAG
jgi:hypothetical protein